MGKMPETGGTCTAGLDDFVKRAVELLKEEMRVKGNFKKRNAGNYLKLCNLKLQKQRVWKKPFKIITSAPPASPLNHVPKNHIQTLLTPSQIQ